MISKSVEFSENQVGFITLYFGARLRLYVIFHRFGIAVGASASVLRQ